MNISAEELDELLEKANTEVIKQDRELYDPFFIEFEDFVVENGHTYTLMSAVYALTNKSGGKPRYNNYSLTICADDPALVTRQVCNKLLETKSKHVPEGSVYYSIMPDGYHIFINTRLCFKISNMPKFRGTAVDQLVGATTGIGLWTGKQVKCQNIYSLVSYLLSLSYDQRDFVPKDLLMSMIKKLIPEVEKFGAGEKKKKSDSEKILKSVQDNPLVYTVHSKGMPTFVYDGEISILQKELGEHFTIRIASYNLHDLDDFALVKYIIHDSDNKPVCVIFNSLNHQIIPIIKGRMTSKRYSARMKLLEIQMLKMMKSIGHLESNFKPIIQGILNEFADLVSANDFYEEDVIGYAGNFINWTVLRRTITRGKTIHGIYPDADGKYSITGRDTNEKK